MKTRIKILLLALALLAVLALACVDIDVGGIDIDARATATESARTEAIRMATAERLESIHATTDALVEEYEKSKTTRATSTP